MSKHIPNQQQLAVISSQCKNKLLIDQMIDTYQKSTRSAVENILNMCSAVKDIDDKFKSKQINDFDVTYFCATVSLEKKSSTYRKYRKIGEHAEKFKRYMNYLPSAYTVLFEITTLDSDKFEELIESNQITPSLSLEKLKQITNKTTTSTKAGDVSFKVTVDSKKITATMRDSLREMFIHLNNMDSVFITVPEHSARYFNTRRAQQK